MSVELRYPQLAFLLRCAREKKRDLENIELIYVVSVARFERFFEFKAWLEKDTERDLVFIEEDLEEMDRFLEKKESKELLDHPQVHIRFLMDKEKREDFYRELCDEFPYRRLEVIGDSALKLKLMRQTTVTHALYQEDLYYHLLSENLLSNIKCLPKAFSADKLEGKFKDVPAIICGAGPSLGQYFKTLKGLEDKALILAGGSTITALTKAGIAPHLSFAIDPNPLELERLKTAQLFEGPLIYGNRLYPGVLDLVNGPFGYKHTQTGGTLEAYFENELGIDAKLPDRKFGEEALSVTTTAIGQAVLMGCNPIILVGVDLAFIGGKSYASGVVEDNGIDVERLKNEPCCSDKYIEQNGVQTLVKWVMESQVISAFAKAHQEIKWFHGSAGGLGFEGIKRKLIDEIPFDQMEDLRGRVHAAIIDAPLNVNADLLNAKLLELKQSLIKLKVMVQEVLDTPHVKPIIELEMVEELGYLILLAQLEEALLKMLKRKFRGDTTSIEKARWQHLALAIDKYIAAC